MKRTLDKPGLRVTTADRLSDRNALTAIENAPQAPDLQPLVDSVRLEIRHGTATVRFSVCDQGPGLSGEALVLAKQRFWRHSKARGAAADWVYPSSLPSLSDLVTRSGCCNAQRVGRKSD